MGRQDDVITGPPAQLARHTNQLTQSGGENEMLPDATVIRPPDLGLRVGHNSVVG